MDKIFVTLFLAIGIILVVGIIGEGVLMVVAQFSKVGV